MTSFRRGALAISGGAAGAQLVMVLSSPILTRLYGADSFGALTTFTAAVGVLSVLMAARLEMVVPVVVNEGEAAEVARSGVLLSVALGLTGAVAVLPAAPAFGRLFDMPQLVPWLWLVPVVAALAATFVVLNQWSVRKARFGVIGVRHSVRAVVTMAGQALGGLRSSGPGGLLLGLLAGYGVGAGLMLRGAGLGGFATWRRTRPLVTLRAHRSTSARLSLAALFNVGGTQVPVLIISAVYPAQVVGLLGLTQRTLAIPATVVGMAVAQVYVSAAASRARNGGQLRALFDLTTKRLAVVAVFMTTVILAIGPWLFEVAFGTEWVEAGVYARLLVIGIAAQLVAVPLSQTLIVAGRSDLQLSWDVGRFVVTCGTVGAAAGSGAGAATTVASLGAALTVTYLVQWWLCRSVLRRWDSVVITTAQESA